MTDLNLGQSIGVSSQGIVLERLAKRTSLRCVLDRDNVDGIGDLIASTISINMRLLHYIIGRIFISKTSHFDFVSKRELALMCRPI